MSEYIFVWWCCLFIIYALQRCNFLLTFSATAEYAHHLLLGTWYLFWLLRHLYQPVWWMMFLDNCHNCHNCCHIGWSYQSAAWFLMCLDYPFASLVTFPMLQQLILKSNNQQLQFRVIIHGTSLKNEKLISPPKCDSSCGLTFIALFMCLLYMECTTSYIMIRNEPKPGLNSIDLN